MAGVRGCSNRITKSIYNQWGKKNTRILKDPVLGKNVKTYFQCIDKRQIVCVYVCVYFPTPHGTPSKGWYYKWRQDCIHCPSCRRLLGVSAVPYHVCGRESPKSNVKLISSIPALYTSPTRYIRLRHMENRGVGVQTPAVKITGLQPCACFIFWMQQWAEYMSVKKAQGTFRTFGKINLILPLFSWTITKPYFHYVCLRVLTNFWQCGSIWCGEFTAVSCA